MVDIHNGYHSSVVNACPPFSLMNFGDDSCVVDNIVTGTVALCLFQIFLLYPVVSSRGVGECYRFIIISPVV